MADGRIFPGAEAELLTSIVLAWENERPARRRRMHAVGDLRSLLTWLAANSRCQCTPPSSVCIGSACLQSALSNAGSGRCRTRRSGPRLKRDAHRTQSTRQSDELCICICLWRSPRCALLFTSPRSMCGHHATRGGSDTVLIRRATGLCRRTRSVRASSGGGGVAGTFCLLSQLGARAACDIWITHREAKHRA